MDRKMYNGSSFREGDRVRILPSFRYGVEWTQDVGKEGVIRYFGGTSHDIWTAIIAHVELDGEEDEYEHIDGTWVTSPRVSWFYFHELEKVS